MQHDQQLEVILRASKTVRVFLYVDDFLVLFECTAGDLDEQAQCIVDIFKTTLAGITLTRELPSDNQLRFLGLPRHFKSSHVCRRYALCLKKSLLPFSSAHSKIVKRSIALAALRSSLNRSCPHEVQVSLESQVMRLSLASFLAALLSDVAEAIVREFVRVIVRTLSLGKLSKDNRDGLVKDTSAKNAVVPYVHRVSNKLKKVN